MQEGRVRRADLSAKIDDLRKEISALEKAAKEQTRVGNAPQDKPAVASNADKKRAQEVREEVCIGDAGAVTVKDADAADDDSADGGILAATMSSSPPASEGAPSAWLLPMLQRRLAKLEKVRRLHLGARHTACWDVVVCGATMLS